MPKSYLNTTLTQPNKKTRRESYLALACKNEVLEEEEVLDLIELLVRVYPEAVNVEDNDGNQAIDPLTYGRLNIRRLILQLMVSL